MRVLRGPFSRLLFLGFRRLVIASLWFARIGSAALGAAAEKPELLTRSIVFVALAEGFATYAGFQEAFHIAGFEPEIVTRVNDIFSMTT